MLGKAVETEKKHDTQSTSGKIHGGAKNRWRIIESSSEEENVEELDPPHIAENPTTLPYSKHTPTSPLHVPDQTTLTEHWDLLEAKREAYTLNPTTDIIDDKQLTLEEAFGIDTKEDLTPIIHDEPIDRPKGQLNILQWNAYHLTDPKIQILSEIAVEEKIDIICIQEMTSMKYPKPPKRLPRFNRPRYILPEGSKGLTIYIRQGLEFTTIKDTYTNKQPKILHQACRIRLTDTTSLRIDNIYIHPDTKSKDKKHFWNYLGSQTEDLQIILGDANERASILGGGNKLLYSTFQQLIDLKGYTVLNTGEPTRIQKSGDSFKYSALDITLATKQSQQDDQEMENYGCQHIGSSTDHYEAHYRRQTKTD